MASEEHHPRTSRSDSKETRLAESVRILDLPQVESIPELPTWRRIETKSSDIFDRIMSDFELKMQERLRKQIEAMTARQRSEEQEEQEPILDPLEDEEDEMSDEDEEDEAEEVEIDPHKEQVKKRAKRAWQIIRRYIKEQSVEKSNQKSDMNWKFLKQTLSNMSNMEKAREDLYQKYLYNETPREWIKGLTYVPEHIFAKATRRVQRGRLEERKGKRSVRDSGEPSPQRAGNNGTRYNKRL